MGFNPVRDTRYFLIAKNSNLPLGIRGSSGAAGTQFEQQAWTPDSPQPQQHFQFDRAPNLHFYIKPGQYDLYLEPLASRDGRGREDGVPIVQAIWNAGAGHQHFLLVPAGDGYYRIRCRHSGKFVDVYGNTTAVGAGVVQHALTSTDNQLFRMVAVPTRGLPVNTTSFQSYTNYGRMLVLGMAGVIPKVGGGIAALIGLIWPSDADQRFWKQMKDYVDVRMTEMLQHQRLLLLEGYLSGLISNLRMANVPGVSPKDRWVHLISITTSARMLESQFLGDQFQDSHRVLSHLAAWGTLVLGAHAQIVRDYAQMHPDLTAEQAALAKAPYKAELLLAIEKYTAAVAAARAAALKWRLEKIGFWEMMGVIHVWDTATGWGKMMSTQSGSGSQIYKARCSQIQAQFEAEMDALLAPARLWRFLSPDVHERPQGETVRKVVGPFPCMRNDTPFEEVTGTITSLSMRMIGGELSGVVVHYDDGRKRVTGSETGGMSTLTLAPNEYIISAYGIERNCYIAALTFETNLGQVFSTGEPLVKEHAIDFMASLDDTLNPRLTGLSEGGGGLCFHWEYGWTNDWTGTLHAAEPKLAESVRPLLAAPAPPAEPAGPDPVQDFTTHEFAAGQW
ncbi:Ricin-type beta-trefoil lectin domain-like [Hymenobacter daecheongensis DSM 21074]|uniref:Ricin-type beta-trefoil lectin domain-like n=1 Tax=Hymenobacter daecheongensis DSM 21074 TaxID=1121955 RepID=A0A1M6I8M9_9BACT|nr:RICIN domain-containing protein [Hymenobacter daecheongensis]SHJ30708.1 Ricin-type beta-trefoil lectin domain-like [Hymenobacter daecheongensis DSM 21074]